MVTSTRKQPYFGLTGKWLTYWITFACSTDMLLFGYDQASFSGVIVTDNFLEVHDLVGPEKTQMLSTVTAIYDIGCFLGAIVAFTIGERLGRTKSIIMFVGRIILGVGNGINTATAPIWQTETAPAHWRGKLVMFEMMMNIAGFSLCNWINYGLSFAGGAVAWRFPLAFQFVFIIALFVTVPWLPESPRWLMSHGRETEATEVLACLEAKPQDDVYVVSQKEEILFSINYEREHQIRWRDLLQPQPEATKPLRRLILGAGTQFIQQFEGAAVATATNWITNYVIVQITPIGIQNLGWKFWIVFTVLNAAFLPIIYLFYPETANRTLEDLDEYYRNNPPLIVIGDKDAIGTKRPQKYVDHEEAQVDRVAHEDGVTEAADKKTSRTEARHVE
ncbi:hypothetical protein K4K59_000594 [Colletotrichum sp. SAR11_240]|nr:hypothetical protein K4K59_000594 [Colletotrichum sp. SAR11_240]